jgi:exodeoxyribonuclease-3
MNNIRIASWNVNSIRARFDILSKWLKKNQYDVIFVQETKVQHRYRIFDLKKLLRIQYFLCHQLEIHGLELLFLVRKSHHIDFFSAI